MGRGDLVQLFLGSPTDDHPAPWLSHKALAEALAHSPGGSKHNVHWDITRDTEWKKCKSGFVVPGIYSILGRY